MHTTLNNTKYSINEKNKKQYNKLNPLINITKEDKLNILHNYLLKEKLDMPVAQPFVNYINLLLRLNPQTLSNNASLPLLYPFPGYVVIPSFIPSLLKESVGYSICETDSQFEDALINILDAKILDKDVSSYATHLWPVDSTKTKYTLYLIDNHSISVCIKLIYKYFLRNFPTFVYTDKSVHFLSLEESFKRFVIDNSLENYPFSIAVDKFAHVVPVYNSDFCKEFINNEANVIFDSLMNRLLKTSQKKSRFLCYPFRITKKARLFRSIHKKSMKKLMDIFKQIVLDKSDKENRENRKRKLWDTEIKQCKSIYKEINKEEEEEESDKNDYDPYEEMLDQQRKKFKKQDFTISNNYMNSCSDNNIFF